MVVFAALAYVLSQQDGGISELFQCWDCLALGAQRLLPSLQQIYYAWASILGSQASLADTLALLDQPLPEDQLQPRTEPISFKRCSFRECTFPLW